MCSDVAFAKAANLVCLIWQKGYGSIPKFCVNQLFCQIPEDHTQETQLVLADGKRQVWCGCVPSFEC